MPGINTFDFAEGLCVGVGVRLQHLARRLPKPQGQPEMRLGSSQLFPKHKSSPVHARDFLISKKYVRTYQRYQTYEYLWIMNSPDFLLSFLMNFLFAPIVIRYQTATILNTGYTCLLKVISRKQLLKTDLHVGSSSELTNQLNKVLRKCILEETLILYCPFQVLPDCQFDCDCELLVFKTTMDLGSGR